MREKREQRRGNNIIKYLGHRSKITFPGIIEDAREERTLLGYKLNIKKQLL